MGDGGADAAVNYESPLTTLRQQTYDSCVVVNPSWPCGAKREGDGEAEMTSDTAGRVTRTGQAIRSRRGSAPAVEGTSSTVRRLGKSAAPPRARSGRVSLSSRGSELIPTAITWPHEEICGGIFWGTSLNVTCAGNKALRGR